MREQEHKFYGRLRDRLKYIRMIRIENTLDSGFPDVLMINSVAGEMRLVELKSEYDGGHVYVRNTQMSYCWRLLDSHVNVLFFVGTLEGGFYILPFSQLKELPYTAWKTDHKRFNTKDFVSAERCYFAPQKSDWEAFVSRVVYTTVIPCDKMGTSQRGD